MDFKNSLVYEKVLKNHLPSLWPTVKVDFCEDLFIFDYNIPVCRGEFFWWLFGFLFHNLPEWLLKKEASTGG